MPDNTTKDWPGQGFVDVTAELYGPLLLHRGIAYLLGKRIRAKNSTGLFQYEDNPGAEFSIEYILSKAEGYPTRIEDLKNKVPAAFDPARKGVSATSGKRPNPSIPVMPPRRGVSK